jgi:hypothetical protein
VTKPKAKSLWAWSDVEKRHRAKDEKVETAMSDELIEPKDGLWGTALQSFRSVEMALRLLTPYQKVPELLMEDDEWLQDEIKKSIASEAPENVAAEAGRIIQGFLLMSVILLDDLAKAKGTSQGHELALFTRTTEETIKGLELGA